MVLVRGDLDFNLISIRTDDEGRYIVLEAEVQGANFLLVNVYVPNKVQEQCRIKDTYLTGHQYLSSMSMLK